MANKVTTEWEDIHVKLGNYLPREKDPTNDELQKIAIESIQNYDPLEHKTLEQLKELEDDDEDDEVIKAYQAKRLAELKEFASKPKFGKVLELRNTATLVSWRCFLIFYVKKLSFCLLVLFTKDFVAK